MLTDYSKQLYINVEFSVNHPSSFQSKNVMMIISALIFLLFHILFLHWQMKGYPSRIHQGTSHHCQSMYATPQKLTASHALTLNIDLSLTLLSTAGIQPLANLEVCFQPWDFSFEKQPFIDPNSQ